MMKKFYILFFVIFLLSCTSTKHNDEIKEIEVDVNQADRVALSNYFNNYQIVPLKSDKVLLSFPVAKIQPVNDEIYILHGSSPAKISVFNKSGTLVRNIDYFGKGPGEFMYIIDFDVDDKKRIHLCCPEKRAILLYDKHGKFIEKRESDIGAYFKYFNQRYHFLTGIFSTELINKGQYEMFHCLDTTMKKKYSYRKFPSKYANINDARALNFFWQYGQKRGCVLPYGDTLYYISDKSLTPAYYINFGKKACAYNEVLDIWTRPTGAVKQMLQNGKAVHPNKIFENDDILFFGYEYGKKNHYQYVFYDKKRDEVQVVSSFKDDLLGYDDINIVAFTENEFVCKIEPYQLKQYVKKKKNNPEFIKKHSDLINLAHKVKNTDNPILVFYKLK
jgi:hypothetical protein